MSKEEILNILPTPEGEEFKKIKENNPYSILLRYSDAINEKYKSKLSATITESSKIEKSDDSETLPTYAFYISAPIGRGYFYKLFEVIPEKNAPYPVDIKLFGKQLQDFGKAENPEDYNKKILEIFKSNFVSDLILNLLAQVDLYNEKEQTTT